MEQNLENSVVGTCRVTNKHRNTSIDFSHLHLQFTGMALVQAWRQVQVCSMHLPVGPGQREAALESVFTGEVRSSQRSK